MNVKFARSLLPVLCTSQQFVKLFSWRQEFYGLHEVRNSRARVCRGSIHIGVMPV